MFYLVSFEFLVAYLGILFCTKLRKWWYYKDPPPLIPWTVIVHKIILLKSTISKGQFLTKKISVPGGNFSNYFMKIIVFSQLYRSKSATLEIAYDMKIDSLLCILYFPLKQ